ncbi:hypothetical protein [Salinibacterium sp.]|uniref:hypothetical protein n=1 Tax=Salinibacterium sp. TaxID=1915057 RepID=UPI00286BB345|nr:hypothetical protein [Salinibacterium sp.]
MPPYTADGHFTETLTEAHKAALAQQRISRQIGEASFHLGKYTSEPALVATDNPGRIRAVVTGLYETTAGIARALEQASNFKDDSLTPEGLADARSDRRAAVFGAVSARIEALSPHIDQSFKAAEKAAEPFWPKFDPENVAQAVRTDQSWARLIQPQLDKGKGWDEIIPTLDHDGLLAVERFAPGHEAASRSRFDQHEVPSSLEGIKRQIEHRVIAAAPEGPARDALQALADAHSAREVALGTIQALYGVEEANGSSPSRLGETLTMAQIQIKRATFDIGAQPVPVEADV